jgi:hypothetical protein
MAPSGLFKGGGCLSASLQVAGKGRCCDTIDAYVHGPIRNLHVLNQTHLSHRGELTVLGLVQEQVGLIDDYRELQDIESNRCEVASPETGIPVELLCSFACSSERGDGSLKCLVAAC